MDELIPKEAKKALLQKFDNIYKVEATAAAEGACVILIDSGPVSDSRSQVKGAVRSQVKGFAHGFVIVKSGCDGSIMGMMMQNYEAEELWFIVGSVRPDTIDQPREKRTLEYWDENNRWFIRCPDISHAELFCACWSVQVALEHGAEKGLIHVVSDSESVVNGYASYTSKQREYRGKLPLNALNFLAQEGVVLSYNSRDYNTIADSLVKLCKCMSRQLGSSSSVREHMEIFWHKYVRHKLILKTEVCHLPLNLSQTEVSSWEKLRGDLHINLESYPDEEAQGIASLLASDLVTDKLPRDLYGVIFLHFLAGNDKSFQVLVSIIKKYHNDDKAKSIRSHWRRVQKEMFVCKGSRIECLKTYKLIDSTQKIIPGKRMQKWSMLVDTTTLLNKESRKALQLLEGLKGTLLVIPRIVIEDCLKRQTSFFSRNTEVSSALEWIKDCERNTQWWIHVQNSVEEGLPVAPTPPSSPYSEMSFGTTTSFAFSTLQSQPEPLSPTVEDLVLDYALSFKRNHSDTQVVLISDDVTLKSKAMSKGVLCETAEEFRESVVNRFSERFLWTDSSPIGRTVSCSDYFSEGEILSELFDTKGCGACEGSEADTA